MSRQIKTFVRGAYDLQKLRIMTGNRLVANFKAKLGQAPQKKAEDELSAEAKKLLDDLKKSYVRIADGVVASRGRKQEFKGDELISTYTEFALVSHYLDLERAETQQFSRLQEALEEIPIYTEFLSQVRGIGPAMAGVIVSEFDITKATYPSSLWRYAGLDVGPDGRGRSKRKEHLVKVKYINSAGEEMERDGITYNPWLKTKLVGVLGTSFLRLKSPYAEYYRNYKHRAETKHKGKYASKLHIHRASIRFMIKRFLADLYVQWRTLEKLPLSTEYHEGKLGHKHRKKVA